MAEYGDHWVRKVKFAIRQIYKKADKVITRNEVLQIGERHIKAAKLTEQQAKETRASYDKLWNDYYSSDAGSEGLTTNKLIENLKQAGKDQLMESVYHVFDALFKAVNHNKSGLITIKEFTAFYEIVGINDEARAKEAFKALDTNHDGVISRGEFIIAAIDFATLEESFPADYLFGKLE